MKLPAPPVCALLLCVLGCGGNGNNNTGGPAPVTSYPAIAGNWLFTGPGASIGVDLAQSGGSLTGTGHVDASCFQQATDVPFTGTVDTSGNLKLDYASAQGIAPSETVVQIRGVVENGALNTPSISVSCGQSGSGGLMGGYLLPSTTGTWTGNLSSDAQNRPLQVSLNLTQGTVPDKDGYLSLTGTGTFAGTCLGTQPVTLTATQQVLPSFQSQTGNIQVGPFVSLGFTDAQNDSIALVGTLTSSGTQLNLNYWSIYSASCRDGGMGSIAKAS